MNSRLRFPIRMKILVALLFVVTGVVSVIVVTMANLFHLDKKAYITDLVSMVAVSTAEESRSVLTGYRERLQVYSRIIGNDQLAQETKATLVRELFEDFPELVGVSLESPAEELASAYNGATLQAVGLAVEDLQSFRREHPLPFDRIDQDGIHVRNSTVSRKLPTLTLTLVHPTSEPGARRYVSAVIRLDALLALAARARAFEVYLADSDGTYLAHSRAANVSRRSQVAVAGRFERSENRISAGMVSEYVHRGVEMIGGTSPSGIAGVIAGARIPKSTAYLASGELLYRLFVVALGLLFLSALVGLFWAHRMTRPVDKLSAATRQIGRGEFDVHVDVDSGDEIGALATSFNRMATELNDRENALSEAQAQLVQSEKLAAFGQLGAGIAHEVKNPLAGILGCAQLSLRKVEKDTPVENNLRLIEKETKRCKSIIENLLRFARQEKAVLRPIQVNPVIVDAVAIVNHQLEMNKVDVQQELSEELPPIHGNANQLQQVVMNLIMNAQQAMEGEPGTVRVGSRLTADGKVEITVNDDGPGIPQELHDKLFEPFFTTKPGGKGTGLGLSVSFGIIKDHGGEIELESAVGRGTTFRIQLPMLADEQPGPYISAQGA